MTLRQNDVMIFLVYIPRVIYINFLVNRQDELYKAVLLLFCCRSESALSIYLSDSRFYHAVGCSECTLLLLCIITNYLRTNIINGSATLNNNRVSDPQMNNDEKENFTVDGDILYRHSPPCSGRNKYSKSAGGISYRSLCKYQRGNRYSGRYNSDC